MALMRWIGGFLDVLQRKGRISNADLAEAVNLSASCLPPTGAAAGKPRAIFATMSRCWTRANGAAGDDLCRDHLTTQADEVLEAFEKAVARIPDVLECHLMAGTADYILKVVAEEHRGFRTYSPAIPDPPAERIAKMQSSFALRTVFKQLPYHFDMWATTQRTNRALAFLPKPRGAFIVSDGTPGYSQYAHKTLTTRYVCTRYP